MNESSFFSPLVDPVWCGHAPAELLPWEGVLGAAPVEDAALAWRLRLGLLVFGIIHLVLPLGGLCILP
jgi:hypothetical protein